MTTWLLNQTASTKCLLLKQEYLLGLQSTQYYGGSYLTFMNFWKLKKKKIKNPKKPTKTKQQKTPQTLHTIQS